MKRIIRAVVMALLLAPGMLWADDLRQQFNAGLEAYQTGDYETAHDIWLTLAILRLAPAQYLLGFMYNQGQGVPQDYAEAAHWYRLAAEQGYARAQFLLGLMYSVGDGVIQDYSTAYMWINIAARNGDSVPVNIRDAIVNSRDVIANGMAPEAIAEAQRRARICLKSDYQDCD